MKTKYPVGIQSFTKIREEDFLYIDKTGYIKDLLSGGYFFLSRPRRFGKSLFLSTLKAFYEGQRSLFRGLDIDTVDWNWDTYPMFHLDLNSSSYDTPSSLNDVLEWHLRDWEKTYGLHPTYANLTLRFADVIKAAYRATGKRVVILVDEYDKPLVNNINAGERFEKFRIQLSDFYSNLKSLDEYIHLGFFTGVSRFGRLSVFSGLNNLWDISLEKAFSAICGITEAELDTCFYPDMDDVAFEMEMTRDDFKKGLKQTYDGYRFSERGEDIYNPFSLMQVFANRRFGSYWVESGLPTLLVEQFKKHRVDLSSVLSPIRVTRQGMVGLDLNESRPAALLYQTGYLSIKAYDPKTRLFTLGMPNLEVTEGFLSFLLPYYTSLQSDDVPVAIYRLGEMFKKGDIETALRYIASFFAGISYQMRAEEEINLHNALLVMMKLLNLDIDAEYATSDGRIDLFVRTDRYYYIMELKVNMSAEKALKQINDKEYALPFSFGDRKIIKVGISFSTEKRTLSDWVIERN